MIGLWEIWVVGWFVVVVMEFNGLVWLGVGCICGWD